MSDEWIHAEDYISIDSLPLDDRAKKIALTWLANVLFRRLAVQELGLDGHGKTYDPLSFSPDGRVHTYVFDLHDGGRHHDFTSFADIEQRIIAETADKIRSELQV